MDCLLSSTDFTWYILEYLDPYNVEVCGDGLQKIQYQARQRSRFKFVKTHIFSSSI